MTEPKGTSLTVEQTLDVSPAYKYGFISRVDSLYNKKCFVQRAGKPTLTLYYKKSDEKVNSLAFFERQKREWGW